MSYRFLAAIKPVDNLERESAINARTVFDKQDSGRLYSIFAFWYPAVLGSLSTKV